MAQLTVWIDPKVPPPSGVKYSNGTGDLVCKGREGETEDILFILREDQRKEWRFKTEGHELTGGNGVIGGQPVLTLKRKIDTEITLLNRLGTNCTHKYTLVLEKKDGSETRISDPEIKNIRDLGGIKG